MSIEGCKCITALAKDKSIKGLDIISNEAIEKIQGIQNQNLLSELDKIRTINNFININKKIKNAINDTEECKAIFSAPKFGDCTCINRITRSFILGSLDKIFNREKDDIKQRLIEIRRDLIGKPNCE